MCFAYLSLANNHILDYCEAGMVQTMRTLKVGWGWMMVQTMRTLKVGWGGKMVQTMRTLKVGWGGMMVQTADHAHTQGELGGESSFGVGSCGLGGVQARGLEWGKGSGSRRARLDVPGPPGP